MQSALHQTQAALRRGGRALGQQRRRAAFRPACQAGESPGGGAAGLKRSAARAAVDRWVAPGSVVGIGTGQMVNYAVEFMAQQAAAGKLLNVVAVPSCAVAANEAAFQGLPLATLEQRPKVDVFLEEADQLDINGGAFLKGIRAEPVQPDLPAFKQLLDASQRVVVLCGGDASVARLGASLPVAIVAEGWEEPAEELDDTFLGDAELWRRPAEGTSNPRGGDNPYVSEDGGHTIVDIRFYEGFKLFGEAEPYARIAEEIEGVPGVLAHGLVVGRAAAAVVADEEAGQYVVSPMGGAPAGAAA